MFDPQVQTLNSILTIEQLRRFQSRSVNYQSDTESVRRSFDELESTGYLIQAVPEELGGLGLSFSEICQQQIQLARYSPADASAVGTHICWTGAAADAWRKGDTSLEWLLSEVCAGEFLAGNPEYPEAVSDLPPSCFKAERVDGGICLAGKLSFKPLYPDWTRLGLRGVQELDAGAFEDIYVLLPRKTEGLVVRCNHLHDIILDAAFVPDKYIVGKMSPAKVKQDPFIRGLLAWTQKNNGA